MRTAEESSSRAKRWDVVNTSRNPSCSGAAGAPHRPPDARLREPQTAVGKMTPPTVPPTPTDTWGRRWFGGGFRLTTRCGGGQ